MRPLLFVLLFAAPLLLCFAVAKGRGRSPWAWVGWSIIGGWLAAGILAGKASKVAEGAKASFWRGAAVAVLPPTVLFIGIASATGGAAATSAVAPTAPSIVASTTATKPATVASSAPAQAPSRSASASVVSSSIAASSTPPAPVKAVVVLDVQGSGSKSTKTFTVPAQWALAWDYNCSSFGMQGNFQVYIYQDGQPDLPVGEVNQLGMKGNDIDYYHSGGNLYMEVNSECDWHVVAQAPPG